MRGLLIALLLAGCGARHPAEPSGGGARAAPPGCAQEAFYILDPPLQRPVALVRVKPVFDPKSLQTYRGSVSLVSAYITSSGRVCAVAVQWHADASIDRSCVNAVMQWQFRPATLNGRPVACIYHFTFPIQ